MTKGTRPGPLPPPSKKGSEGRVCAHPGCTTALSVYNRFERCWQHTDVVFPTFRGRSTERGSS